MLKYVYNNYLGISMNILIISNSLIVKELLKLVLDGKDFNVEYKNRVQEANETHYALIFIDNTAKNLIEQIDFLEERVSGKIVLLGSSDSAVDEIVDRVIQKPFLPADIEELLDTIEISQEPKPKTKILDPDEIARIKALMALDDEESEEPLDELDYIERLEEKESLKLKKKEAKELIYELAKLSKKEIKNLLKGAKVSIKIEYKKGDDE